MAPKYAEETPGMVVVRDAASGEALKRVLVSGKKDRRSWRTVLREVTDDGSDLLLHMHRIAMGQPLYTTLPDGRVSEPVIASPAVQGQFAKDLFEFLNGKAVPQTEVMKAEQQLNELETVRGMSDEQLMEIAAPYLERVARQKGALPEPKAENEAPSLLRRLQKAGAK